MDCLPLDDLCRLHAQYTQRVIEARNDLDAGATDMVLGTFNGRVYRYMLLDGAPAIVIESVDPDDVYGSDILTDHEGD